MCPRTGDQIVIGLLGDLRAVDPDALRGLRGVERVITGSRAFQLASLRPMLCGDRR